MAGTSSLLESCQGAYVCVIDHGIVDSRLVKSSAGRRYLGNLQLSPDGTLASVDGQEATWSGDADRIEICEGPQCFSCYPSSLSSDSASSGSAASGSGANDSGSGSAPSNGPAAAGAGSGVAAQGGPPAATPASGAAAAGGAGAADDAPAPESGGQPADSNAGTSGANP